jgi:hypothetical protein
MKPRAPRPFATPSRSSAQEVAGRCESKRREVQREALDVGIAELDARLGVQTSPDELMEEIYPELGLRGRAHGS